ncbi:MAG: Ldh family oxidoreductase [Chloroflexi bacterium]|nr:Ldh family oxidoreductase [Chloroflexota bacterium]
MITFTADRLLEVGQRIFLAVGAPEPIAQRVASALVDANLVGHDSHGVIRIPAYVQLVERGYVLPKAQPTVSQDSETTVLVDGGWAFGQVSGEFATRLAIQRARAHKVALVGIVRCNHLGRLGEYTTMAAEKGIVAMVTAGGFGGPTGVAPFGGAGGAFGTNPISFGLPAGEEPGVLVDYATSAVAQGKIQVARAKREPLPPGCILDPEGRPTTDPEDFFRGGVLLPFGGHKGYGLAMVIELLGQALTGAADHTEPGRGGPVYGKSGAIVLAIDAGAFCPAERYRASADATIRRVRGVKPAPGFERVLIPGDPERLTAERRRTEGIPVAEATWEAIVTTGRRLGVDVG